MPTAVKASRNAAIHGLFSPPSAWSGRDEDEEDICEYPVFGHELDEDVPLPDNLWASCSADTQLG
ncbi:MAG: hypothetical protein ACYS21_01700 [Planctomycetota bacterium]